MNLQFCLFGALALVGARRSSAQYLALDAYGTTLEIAGDEVEYDQNQNHKTGVAPTVSDDHTTLHVKGNRWSAYKLPSEQIIHENTVLQFTYTLTEDTQKGFQAVCLDVDLELSGPNGQCFVLSTTQGWIDDMINVATLTAVGQTTHHSIPVGRFFTGPVKYLAYLQDSDGRDRSKGESSISGIRLVRQDDSNFGVEINGVPEELKNHQLPYNYDGTQDTIDWLMKVSEDGSGMQLNGNHWKALALNSPYNITHFTVLEFDVVVTDPAEIHAICLDEDLDGRGGKASTTQCVRFLRTQACSRSGCTFHVLTTQLRADEPRKMVIPFGQILGLTGGESRVGNYLAFVQDEDRGDMRGGRSTFSNFRIYEEDRMNISIEVFGQDVTVPNVQDSFTVGRAVQDSSDHVVSVSADGKSLTSTGNSFKSFRLAEPFDVGPSTALRFSFSVAHEVEIHAVCLLDSAGPGYNAQHGRKDCFTLAGTHAVSSSWFHELDHLSSGESKEYEVWVGSYFTGPVLALGFAQDNDMEEEATRATGESTWSNIEIYNLPSLSVGLDGGSFAIKNNQVSYDQGQDSTPIRDHLAVVSGDGSAITLHGNAWRAFALAEPKSKAELGDFVVSFDYVVKEKGELHAICFEDNLELGDYDDPADNARDPRRCLSLNNFDRSDLSQFIELEYPDAGESYRYVANLGKLFERFEALKYLVMIQDNDAGDKSGGEMTISNIHVTTSLASCLKETDYTFRLSDCTVGKFLAAVQVKMADNSCPTDDPLMELMAFFDATHEKEVYKEIEHICKSSYKPHQYDFASEISSQTQLVPEFIDGGTVLNYERDSEGSSLAKDGAAIGLSDDFAASHLLSWPKHHALDRCDEVGAAMCCWVDSRSEAELVDNTDVCYVDMKASRRTAHVADGYSVYGDSSGTVNCHGFAWDPDAGSISSALKGNALFKVGFMNNFYKNAKGNVEQVPGAPMCGCVDRMPVVTNAACTKVVADDASVVDVTYYSEVGAFRAKLTMGSIEYEDCGDLNAYYKTLVGEDSPKASYIDTRIVGEGGCHGAINDFLARKGLIKA